MKKNYLINSLIVLTIVISSLIMERALDAQNLDNKNSFYHLTLKSIYGKPVKMSEFRGKVALVVNTASKCGFTSQYEGLEELYNKYKDQGFVVLGFPSNDFGKQEPGTNEEIVNFCKVNYGVSFPLFEKAAVKGPSKQEAFKVLTESSPIEFNGDPGWNFVKFLIDKNGHVRGRFSSMTSPKSNSISSEIEKLLKEEL